MTTVELPLNLASAFGDRFLELLKERGLSKRAEVVGSVRRQKALCGDVEILLEPAEAFENPATFSGALDDMGLIPGAPAKNGARAPNGPRYYRKAFPLDPAATRLFQVDLFVALPPAEWGILELIRTGDKDFSQAMVTRLHRFDLRTEGGHLVVTKSNSRYGWKPLAPPHAYDEAAFFALVGVPFIPPENRDWALDATRKAVLAP